MGAAAIVLSRCRRFTSGPYQDNALQKWRNILGPGRGGLSVFPIFCCSLCSLTGFSSGNPDTPGVGKLPHLFMMGCQWHAIPFSSPCSPIMTILLARSLSEKQVTAAGSKLQSCLCMGRRFHGHLGQTRVAWQVTGVGVKSFFAAQVTGWDSMHHPLWSACVGNRCRVFRANRSENCCKQTCYCTKIDNPCGTLAGFITAYSGVQLPSETAPPYKPTRG